MAGGGKLPIRVSYRKLGTIAVSFESIRLEAVSPKAVRLEGLRGYKAVNLDLML